MEPLARAVLYIALMLMVGLPVALAGVVLPTVRQHGVTAQPLLSNIRRRLVAASLAMLAGASLFFVAQVAPLELAFSEAEEWIEFVRLSLLGQMWLARLALGSIALLALQRSMRPAVWLTACALAGLGTQATITHTSHSAAMGDDWMPVAADFAHLLAGALWGGGLAALLVAMRVVRQADPVRDEVTVVALTRSLIARFSPVGVAGVALAAGTGLVLSSVHVTDGDALRTSDYGRLILLKVGLTFGAVALAALHKFVTWRRMRAMADIRCFGRTLWAEALLVASIFASAALLASTSPPHHTVLHQMADGSTHVMTVTDPAFQRSLQIAALAIFAAGVVALVLEWRRRSILRTK